MKPRAVDRPAAEGTRRTEERDDDRDDPRTEERDDDRDDPRTEERDDERDDQRTAERRHARDGQRARDRDDEPAKQRAGGRAMQRDDERAREHDDAHGDAPDHAPRVAIDSRDARPEVDAVDGDAAKPDPELAVRRRPPAAPARRWHLTIGPYLWASAVDANVSLGSTSVGGGVDFVPLERHAKYGAEVLAEARYGRLAITGDLMYGAVAINGAAGIGPVMTSLTGNASSLLVDGAVGYAVAGDEHAPLSLEVRGGIRYQRTAVNGEVGLGGYTLQTPESVAAGSDALVGARGFVRPCRWFYVSGVVDAGVVGASNLTWSASADLSVRATSFLLISLGWRTLTLDRAQVSVVMHGPRAAVQLTF